MGWGGGVPRGPPLNLFENSPTLAIILAVMIAAAIIAILIWSYRQDGE